MILGHHYLLKKVLATVASQKNRYTSGEDGPGDLGQRTVFRTSPAAEN